MITENAGDLHRGDFRVKLGNICQVFLKNLHIFSLGANTQHRSRIQHDAALHHRRTVEYAAIGFIQLVPGLLSHNPVRRQAKGALECHHGLIGGVVIYAGGSQRGDGIVIRGDYLEIILYHPHLVPCVSRRQQGGELLRYLVQGNPLRIQFG